MNGLGKASRGFSLIETLIALGIFGAIAVAFMAGLASNYRATDIVDERVRAENVARSVLEDIRSQPYLDSYTVSVTPPLGYSYTITTAPYCTPTPCTPDNNIQKNTVDVSRNGERLTELSDLRTNR